MRSSFIYPSYEGESRRDSGYVFLMYVTTKSEKSNKKETNIGAF